MPVFSTLRPLFRSTPTIIKNAVAIRQMSEHRIFHITPTRWQHKKFKDFVHFYGMVGFIPLGLSVLYINCFIGPATLSETPEEYEPKHWEYYRSPITRFISRYILPSPQQDYEKFLHYLFQEDEKRRLRALEAEIKEKMSQRNDYQAYYYRPIAAKYHRVVREAAESVKDFSSKF